MTDPTQPLDYTPHPEWEEHCSSDENTIVCPYCLSITTDAGEYFHHNPNAEKEFECEECERVSMISLEVTYTFHAKPIDPEVPRRPFPVTVWLEGWSRQLKISPSHDAMGLIITALVSRRRDPFEKKDHLATWQVQMTTWQVQLESTSHSAHSLTSLSSTRRLVDQGVRAGHHLYITRKADHVP